KRCRNQKGESRLPALSKASWRSERDQQPRVVDGHPKGLEEGASENAVDVRPGIAGADENRQGAHSSGANLDVSHAVGTRDAGAAHRRDDGPIAAAQPQLRSDLGT